MRAMTNQNAGRLIVSTTPSFAASWLVPRLEGFKAKNPSVAVLIEATPQLVQIGHGSADVAIRFGVKDHGSYVVHRLFDEELCALCSPSVAFGPPKIVRLEDLENVPLLRWDLSQFDWATNTIKWNDWKYWLTAQGAEHITPGEGGAVHRVQSCRPRSHCGAGIRHRKHADIAGSPRCRAAGKSVFLGVSQPTSATTWSRPMPRRPGRK